MKDSILLIVLGIVASILFSVCSGPSAPQWQSSQVVALMVAAEGTSFLIPSLGEAKVGRIRSFDSPEDLEKTKAYAVKLSKESAAFFSWVFVKDNILVQLDGKLPEEQAKKYEAALNALK
jgi:hypothetical protein